MAEQQFSIDLSSLSSLATALSSHPNLLSIRHTIRQSIYRSNPQLWVRERLGEHTWSKQNEILQSVADNRRTVAYSCHRIGKTYIMARIAMWWIDTHEPGEAIVVTSAHSGTQVKASVWREMGRIHAKGKFPGRMNQTEWWMTMPQGNEEMVAFGRKPADNDPGAFQGTYSKYVLFLLDEGCYVPAPLWDAADTLIGNETSRIFAAGNPDDPTTEFADVCKPGSGWNVIQIGYQDTPNFTGEQVPRSISEMLIGPTWVAEKKRKWGEDNPLYKSKVLGQFPDMTQDGLIPFSWIRDAQARSLEYRANDPIELGVDIGGGGNKTVICLRKGPIARIIRRDNIPDTMQTTGNVINSIKETGATSTKIDMIGIGRGVVDRAKELKISGIVGVNVGETAHDSERFANIKAEGFWGLRERFEDGTIDIDIEDDDLAAQLVALRYKPTSAGKIQIESKKDWKGKASVDEIRNNVKPSPDDADALMLAFLKIYGEGFEFVWGD